MAKLGNKISVGTNWEGVSQKERELVTLELEKLEKDLRNQYPEDNVRVRLNRPIWGGGDIVAEVGPTIGRGPVTWREQRRVEGVPRELLHLLEVRLPQS